MSVSEGIEKGERLALGDEVFPRGNRSGRPGVVIRLREGRATVLWSQPLDYIGTRPAAHLAVAEDRGKHGAA